MSSKLPPYDSTEEAPLLPPSSNNGVTMSSLPDAASNLDRDPNILTSFDEKGGVSVYRFVVYT